MLVVDPSARYRIADEICPLIWAGGNLAAGANQQLRAATTGKRVGIMGWDIQSQDPTNVAGVLFRNGFGGAAIGAALIVPGYADGKRHEKENKHVILGYTDESAALHVDITSEDVFLNIWLVVFKLR